MREADTVVAAVVEAVAVVPMLLVTCAAWAVVIWAVALLLPTEAASEALAMAAMAALHPTVVDTEVATAAVVMETRPVALPAHLPGGKSVVVSDEAIGSGCLLSNSSLFDGYDQNDFLSLIFSAVLRTGFVTTATNFLFFASIRFIAMCIIF